MPVLSINISTCDSSKGQLKTILILPSANNIKVLLSGHGAAGDNLLCLQLTSDKNRIMGFKILY